MVPDILLAGHIVKDITGDGWRPGGGVTYGAAQALRLGLSVAVMTSCGPDMQPETILPDAAWHIVPAASSTTFENRYAGGRREQRVLARAACLRPEDVPEAWRSASLIALCPVIEDMEPSFGREIARGSSFLAVGAQGWLRRLVGDRVVPVAPSAAPEWLHGHAVFISDEDVADAEAVAAWQEHVSIVALTRSLRGCTVWHAGERLELGAFEADELDPTGAGDVFMVAFTVRYHETGDVLESARFAAAASAISVAQTGIDGVGSRAEIENVMRSRQLSRQS